jgi:hypothetical protein
MLSRDLNNIAASVRNLRQQINEGHHVCMGVLGQVANNIEDCACQARELENQMAPGSPIIDNVVRLAAEKRVTA